MVSLNFVTFLAVVVLSASALPIEFLEWKAELEDEFSEENPEEAGFFEGDMLVDPAEFRRNAILGSTRLWPKGVVPYVLDSNAKFSTKERDSINRAIGEYNSKTCIRWVPRKSEKSYVVFRRNKGCYSSVGKRSTAQTLSLGNGCFRIGTVIHEMMHAIGFHHEQSRTDRDTYVTIVTRNIKPGKEGNFRMYSSKQIQHLGATYDYSSVMHYGSKAFSVNGKETIVVKKPGAKIGQRTGFSSTDIYKINKLYNCGKIGSGPVKPTVPPVKPSGLFKPKGSHSLLEYLKKAKNTKTVTPKRPVSIFELLKKTKTD